MTHLLHRFRFAAVDQQGGTKPPGMPVKKNRPTSSGMPNNVSASDVGLEVALINHGNPGI
jgi:hypothetical protein